MREAQSEMIALRQNSLASFLMLSVLLFVNGCDSEGNATNNLDGETFGRVISFDVTTIILDGAFNKWGEIQNGTSILEILLEIKDDPFKKPTPSAWSLNIRSMPNPNGLTDISELDVRLFTNYSSECCANSADPVGRFESYDRSFVAVAGSIDFNTSYEGVFDLYLQEEIPARSNNVLGPIVNIKGCWKIVGEGTAPGCNI